MHELIPCKSMFCNGTEFEWFIETQCEKCTKFRKGRCKTFRAICDARFDASRFQYSSLLDFADGCAGKVCKAFTDEPIQRKRHDKPIAGQFELGKELTGDAGTD